MLRICYMSRKSSSWTDDALDDILHRSRANNATTGITGLLLFDGRGFIQALEGDVDAVTECFARIRNDDRHRDIEVVMEGKVARREFGDWHLTYHAVDGSPCSALKEAVRRDVAGVADIHLQAMFIGFAVLAR